MRASRKLKDGKAHGVDNLPAEFWKAILEDTENEDNEVLQWVLEFCNSIWSRQIIPKDWRLTRVAALFKKGDMGDCGNYRPIFLLCAGYKIFAIVILTRIKEGGAEDRISSTQFGFKSGRGTADAILLARRILEQVTERKEGKLMMLALDWAKAFDSISPDRLILSLRRFGIPEHMVGVIQAIYSDRNFFVRAGGVESN